MIFMQICVNSGNFILKKQKGCSAFLRNSLENQALRASMTRVRVQNSATVPSASLTREVTE